MQQEDQQQPEGENTGTENLDNGGGNPVGEGTESGSDDGEDGSDGSDGSTDGDGDSD